jgi:YjjG family noncanonical pyrimidine nucleotidase
VPPFRAILFDLDHTLLDFDRAQRGALRSALAGFGLPFSPSTLLAYRRINDELWALYRRGGTTQRALATERFRRLLRHLGGDPRRSYRLGETFLDELSRRGDRLPGCRPVLARLARRYRMGVVTNGIDRVQRSRLAASGLEPFFEVVVTSGGCGYAKPDPRILRVALRALTLSPRQALYVGDDVATDGRAASRAGVPFCWMEGTSAVGRRSRRRVANLRALLDLLL